MDMIFHHNRSVKSVEANSNSTAVISEYVIILNCWHIAVSQEDSPAPVGEDQISVNIRASDMGEADPYLIVVDAVPFQDHSHVVVVVKVGILDNNALSFAVVDAAFSYTNIVSIHPD